jgi:ribonucleoside-diphosphate reductase alpha chain
MISAVFRRGGDVSFVVDELKAVFDPRGGAWVGGKYIPSILAAIGGVLEEHMMKIGFIRVSDEAPIQKSTETNKVENLKTSRQKSCSSCGQFDLQMIEGCMTCRSCGYSKCG